MDKIINKDKEKWIRPWNIKQFDDLYNRDDRFISVLIKGTIAYLNQHIKMYDKYINHFIFNTGSSYLYVESNGYEFSWNETSGEDYMYTELPRCIIKMNNISIPQEELSQPWARGNYERKENDTIKGFNAEIKRIPIELHLNLQYALSNFNEGIILMQELIDELIFQKYFNIVYLGQIIKCSIEFTSDYSIDLTSIDLGTADTSTRMLNIDVTINSNYPLINEKTEISNKNVIAKFGGFVNSDGSDDGTNIIEIYVDGSTVGYKFTCIDLRKFDINNDNKIDEEEINIIKEFIKIFDLDKDGTVTEHDIDLVAEYFINGEYIADFDILHKGVVDNENLEEIKEVFDALDINKDNQVSQIEINIILDIINKLLMLDINNDLQIDTNDINNIISYVENNKGLTLSELLDEFTNIMDLFINYPDFYKDIISYIDQLTNYKIFDYNYKDIIEFYLNKYEIDKDVVKHALDKLYKILDKIIKFLKYDINKDGVLNDNDINMIVDLINEYSGHQITYKVSSNIILHSSGHVNDNTYITDKVDIAQDINSYEDGN